MDMLRQDSNNDAVVYAINELKNEFTEFVKEMREARNEAVEERISMTSKISSLETKVATLSKLAWGAGGLIVALLIETAIVIMGKF